MTETDRPKPPEGDSAIEAIFVAASVVGAFDDSQAMLRKVRDARAELAELREKAAERNSFRNELIFSLTVAMTQGFLDQKSGWRDSMSNSDVLYAGNRLVELGLWERRPDGVGRRQFYRELAEASG